MSEADGCCGGGCHTPGMEIQAAPKPLYKVGDRVRHIPFEGVVTLVRPGCTEITVERDGTSERWSVETYPDPDYPFGPEWEVIGTEDEQLKLF